MDIRTAELTESSEENNIKISLNIWFSPHPWTLEVLISYTLKYLLHPEQSIPIKITLQLKSDKQLLSVVRNIWRELK
jgi:hypothetical protein